MKFDEGICVAEDKLPASHQKGDLIMNTSGLTEIPTIALSPT